MAETVCLEASQLVASSAVARNFKTLTDTSVYIVLRKLDARLNADLVGIYTHLGSDDEETDGEGTLQAKKLCDKGMDMLAQLRDLREKVHCLHQVLVGVKSNDCTVGTLHGHILRAASANLAFCHTPCERLLKRVGREMLDNTIPGYVSFR